MLTLILCASGKDAFGERPSDFFFPEISFAACAELTRSGGASPDSVSESLKTLKMQPSYGRNGKQSQQLSTLH